MAANSNPVPPFYGQRAKVNTSREMPIARANLRQKTGPGLRLFINSGSDGVHRIRRNSIGFFVKTYDKKVERRNVEERVCVGKQEPRIPNK